MARFTFAVLVISAFGVAKSSGQQQASELTFDALTFKSMCANPMVPFAHTLCFNAAIKLEDNLVAGMHTYTIAPKGKILFGMPTPIKSSFSIIPSGSDPVINIACTSVSNALGQTIPLDTLTVYPASFDDSPMSLIDGKQVDEQGNPLGYWISGTYKRGVAIVFNTAKTAIKCEWSDPSANQEFPS